VSRLQRLVAHTRTRAKKQLAGSSCKPRGMRLSRKDEQLIRSAAREALGKQEGWVGVSKQKQCAAWISDRDGIRRCRRLAGKTGYCKEHEGGQHGH